MKWEWTSIDSMSAISKDVFSTLHDPAQLSSPFLHYSFLHALEKSHSVGANSGWQPKHLILKDELSQIIGFIPAYIKSHSYGEYVFDHSWANAYHQHGLPYYPKLLIAIPFTPVTGPRILLARNIKMANVIEYLGQKNKQIMELLEVSSIHLLFADSFLSNALASDGFHQRQSVQFNWHNNDYRHMDDFMATLTARRRRSIKKERASISKQGVQIKKIVGTDIRQSDMQFFYNCYQQTYLKRSGHSGYLTKGFFTQLLQSMPENLLLVVASKVADEHKLITSPLSETLETNKNHTPAPSSPIASALFLYDEHGLYGRYWGSIVDVSNLHFEVCYYQGIEFCIEHNIGLFNPGTQGEHKILRGFAPTICYSNHKMNEDAFDLAVEDFLVRETPHITDYARQSEALLPYNKDNKTQ
jgi:predicted N-acyltransferase